MSTSHFYNANRFSSDVQLRKRQDGNRAARSSKVTSMIELFSADDTVKTSSVHSRPYMRNSNAVFTEKEVIKTDIVRRNNNRAKERPVSAAVRIPKPFLAKNADSLKTQQSNSNRSLTSEKNFEKENSKVKNISSHRISPNTKVEFKDINRVANSPVPDSRFNLVVDLPENKNSSSTESNHKQESTVMTTKSNSFNKFDATSGNMSNPDEITNNKPKPSEFKNKSPEFKEKSSERKMATERTDFLNQKDGKRIMNARNYWEHKMASKSGSLNIRNTQSLSPSRTSPKLNTVRSKFETSDERSDDSSPNKFGGENLSLSNQKPAVPTRPRFMTTTPSLSPKPFVNKFAEKSTLSPISTNNAKPNPRLWNNNKKISPPISPLARSPPPSPRFKTDANSKPVGSPKKLNTGEYATINKGRKQEDASDPNNNALGVNPVPKPQRTFTFTPADVGVPKVPPRPRHKNVTRISSDLSTLNEPGFKTNLTNSFLHPELYNSTPDISTRSPKEGYEEVVFCTTQDAERRNTGPGNLMQTWKKQHNYEDVNDAVANSRPLSSYNYDHIDLKKPPRHRSLSELETDNYSRLTFEQDLATSTRQSPNKSSVSSNSSRSPQHMKLKKINSDLGLPTNGNVAKPEKNMDFKMKLQITDKIRDAFMQISRKYHHNLKDNDDMKSLNSSSGDEDSDTEMDMNKHRQIRDRTKTMQRTYRHTLKYKSLERELSGLEKNPLFEQVLICKIVKDQNGKPTTKISYRFPAPTPGKTMGDEKTLSQFCFPDIEAVEKVEEMMSQSYAFMLTREDGTRKFGYCRRILPPGDELRYPVVYCLISPLGSFGLYETILDELEMRHRVSNKKVAVFLEALSTEHFPDPGRSIRVTIDEPDCTSYFMLRRPFDTRLEHVDLQCLLYELGVENTIKIFTSLLLERRVIICGKSLSILTACIHALRALLYPFVWQHVFIPVLPVSLVDLCCSPTPLLIGILETSLPKLKTLPLEEVLIVNQSTQEVISSAGDELEILPRKLQTPLINSLESHTSSMHGNGAEPSYHFALDYESAERNTVISESFMHLFVEMIGHYQSHLQPNTQNYSPMQTRFGKNLRTFNRISFYEDVTSRSLRRFLDLFMGTQMFDGFIHSRELANLDYEGLFERRIARHLLTVDASHLNFKVFKTKMRRFMQGIGKKKI